MIKPLLVTGSISIDRIMNFKGRYLDLVKPEKIHALSLSVLIDSLTDTRGGTGANIAYNYALLGGKPILLGAIGKEASSYLKDLEHTGIDTSHVILSDLPTATFTVLTDQSNNQVGGFYPGAMSDSEKTSLSPFFQIDPLVIISANDPLLMRRLVAECYENHLTMVYDIGQQVSNVDSLDLLAGVKAATILILNDYELSVLSQKTNLSLAELNSLVPLIVTTLGEHGSRITGNTISSPIEVPVVPNISPLDPTGAGDAYRAGFIYGYLRNLDLKVCGRLGSCLASYTVEKFGTQTHNFTIAEFSARYELAYNEPINIF